MMVVVADPRLVAGHRPGRLDAAQQRGIGQHAQHVVHRLVRDGAEILAGGADERLGVGVWSLVNGDQDRDPGARDPQRRRAQQALGVGNGGHGPTLPYFLEPFKFSAPRRWR